MADIAESRTVKVGDTEYTIGRFKGYKALRIGRMLTSLGEIGPELSSKVNGFINNYRKENVERIPRATLEFRYPEQAAVVSEEAWKEADGAIELANDPSQAEIMAVILPTAFELAGDKVVDLLAWVIADDTELERKDSEGEEAITSYIEELSRTLLFRGELNELLDLASAAVDVLSEQLSGKAEQAKRLLALIGMDGSGEEEPEDRDPEQEGQEEPRVAASPEFEEDEESKTSDGEPSTPGSPSPSERPDSSTDSHQPTDGDESGSSSAQSGEPSLSTST